MTNDENVLSIKIDNDDFLITVKKILLKDIAKLDKFIKLTAKFNPDNFAVEFEPLVKEVLPFLIMKVNGEEKDIELALESLSPSDWVSVLMLVKKKLS